MFSFFEIGNFKQHSVTDGSVLTFSFSPGSNVSWILVSEPLDLAEGKALNCRQSIPQRVNIRLGKPLVGHRALRVLIDTGSRVRVRSSNAVPRQLLETKRN